MAGRGVFEVGQCAGTFAGRSVQLGKYDTLRCNVTLRAGWSPLGGRQQVVIPHEVVIHEAALRFRVSDRATTRAQLRQLLELSEADHVTLRVVPFDLDDFAKASSTMTYVGGPLSKLDTVVRDAPHGSVLIDSEAQLTTYRTSFRRVEAASLEPERSRGFIHKLEKEL